MDALLRSPLADAPAVGLTERGARDVLAVITASYEEHGGFRLRTAGLGAWTAKPPTPGLKTGSPAAPLGA
jgi:hypothetical protein